VALLFVFLHHNLHALDILDIRPGDLVPVNHRFFYGLFQVQATLAFLVAVVVAPTLISADLAHNALPLYFSRPLSRTQYIAGKVLVVAVLMSVVTWVPDVLLVLLQTAFEGMSWFGAYGWLLGSVVAAGLSWALLVSVVAVALSAWLKWKPVASGALVALFIVPTAFAEMAAELFGTHWTYLLSLSRVSETVGASLFRRTLDPVPPVWAAWLVGLVALAAALALLRWRVHAYEVVT
jgi:ABC-2 type transport system permease protein